MQIFNKQQKFEIVELAISKIGSHKNEYICFCLFDCIKTLHGEDFLIEKFDPQKKHVHSVINSSDYTHVFDNILNEFSEINKLKPNASDIYTKLIWFHPKEVEKRKKVLENLLNEYK